MFLVISCSLHPSSRSRILAKHAAELLESTGEQVDFVDLSEFTLPLCDGATCYGIENVSTMGKKIREAEGILIASPIYNYDLNAAAKNMIELTGRAWTEKVVGFLCAAGGRSSYMGVMSLANSLMLDFRSFIIPRFVYAEGKAFDKTSVTDPEIETRLNDLVSTLVRVSRAVNQK